MAPTYWIYTPAGQYNLPLYTPPTVYKPANILAINTKPTLQGILTKKTPQLVNRGLGIPSCHHSWLHHPLDEISPSYDVVLTLLHPHHNSGLLHPTTMASPYSALAPESHSSTRPARFPPNILPQRAQKYSMDTSEYYLQKPGLSQVFSFKRMRKMRQFLRTK